VSAHDAQSPHPAGDDGWQAIRRAETTVRAGELLCLLGAAGLLAALLTLQWYGTVGAGGLERAGASRTVGAWPALPVARWLMVATVLAGLLVAWLGLRRRSAGGSATAALATAAGLAGLTTVVLGYRVLIAPPQADRILDVKLGACIGLGASLAVALGALDGWRRALEGRHFAGETPVHGAGRQDRLAPAP
jgi:hypothetical protein